MQFFGMQGCVENITGRISNSDLIESPQIIEENITILNIEKP